MAHSQGGEWRVASGEFDLPAGRRQHVGGGGYRGTTGLRTTGPRDWKVPWTRRLESLRYGGGGRCFGASVGSVFRWQSRRCELGQLALRLPHV